METSEKPASSASGSTESGDELKGDVIDHARALREDLEYSEQAGQLWSNYVKLAERCDKAVSAAWKDDMNGVIIFAGLYSAALTAFLVESFQNLKEDPAETSAALLRQTVFLLGQISQQIGPNGSHVNVTLPDHIPPFHAAPSDRRVNTLWFLSLILSLSAVLAATIIQQWAGYRMQVFQKLDNPIECSRIRQYLYEGTAKWNLNIVVETIPGLIHMALFLFFIGLVDFLFSLDTIVASIASALILFTVLSYLGSTSLPLLNAQSPFQTPLSNTLWWFLQRLRRRYGREGGTWPSANMFDGRTQQAMAVSSGRAKRDARALRWFITSPMDGTDFELFLDSIPASVNSVHGRRIWNRAVRMQEHLHITGIPRGLVMHPLDDLAGRIGQFLQSCVDQSTLGEATRQRRARAGINAVLSLMFAGGNKWGNLAAGHWGFLLRSPTVTRSLVYLASVDMSNSSFSDLGGTSVASRVCLSIITVSLILTHDDVRRQANDALKILDEMTHAEHPDTPLREHFIDDMDALWTAADLLKNVEAMRRHYEYLPWGPFQSPYTARHLKEEIEEELRAIVIPKKHMGFPAAPADGGVPGLSKTVASLTQDLIWYIPGAVSDPCYPYGQQRGLFLTHILSSKALAVLVYEWATHLRGLIRNAYPTSLVNLSSALYASALFDSERGPRIWIATQYALLQDLRDGGMIYGILLLVSAVQAIRPSTREAQAAYVKTFNVITSDWVKYQQSECTHLCLVELLDKFKYPNPALDMIPPSLFDAIVVLIGNVLCGTHSSNTARAREFLTHAIEFPRTRGNRKILVDCLQKIS